MALLRRVVGVEAEHGVKDNGDFLGHPSGGEAVVGAGLKLGVVLLGLRRLLLPCGL